MVAYPAARAVRIGGSSVDGLTTCGLLDVQVSPVTDCPLELKAWIGCVWPTTRLSMLGTSVTDWPLPPPPPPNPTGTVKLTALLQTSFCSTRATPLTALEAT